MTSRGPMARHRQLAGLAMLEVAVRLVLRDLHAGYPVAAPGEEADDLELIAARMLTLLCDELLGNLDELRAHVSRGCKDAWRTDPTDWPF